MKIKVLLPLILLVLMIACAPSTQLIGTWTDPDLGSATIQPFNKVLVIARISHETSNRIAEDKIVASVRTSAVPSYSILLQGDTSQAAVDAKLQKEGIDGLIVMSLREVNKSLNYQPPTYYGGYHGGYYGYRGYYGYGYGSPGYLTEDQTFYVETSIYSLVTGKMIWSGTTATLNPTELEKTLDDIIIAVRNELTRKGLIKE